MKITKINIENYLGIGRFKTDNIEKMNLITGDNGVGKSAVLKAIKEAFSSSGNDINLIKVNSKKAEILIEIDDGLFKVERKITPSANRVSVVHDGNPLDKPQAWLRGVLGQFTFNPIDFFHAKNNKKVRRSILLSAMPLTITPEIILDGGESPIELGTYDYTKHGLDVLKDIQKAVYDRRHLIGIQRDQLQKSINQDKAEMPENINKKQLEGFSLNDKIAEKVEAEKALTQYDNDVDQVALLRKQAGQTIEEVERLQEKLKSIQAEGKILTEKIESFSVENTNLHIKNLQKSISEYQAFNKLTMQLKGISKRENELGIINRDHRALDDFYKRLTDKVPRELMSQVKLPVDNLRIGEDTIYVNDVDIDKLSTSEQLKFSIQIAKKLAGKLKVICVDRFETLSKSNRKIFESESAQDEFEYFMTIVTDGELKHEAIAPAPDTKTESPDKPQTQIGF